jgi:hypothetical protein
MMTTYRFSGKIVQIVFKRKLSNAHNISLIERKIKKDVGMTHIQRIANNTLFVLISIRAAHRTTPRPMLDHLATGLPSSKYSLITALLWHAVRTYSSH